MTRWFGTDQRRLFRDHIESIPQWKILLLIARSPRKWRLAVACATIACEATNRWGDYELFDQLVRRSDEQWAEILDVPLEPASTTS